MLSISNTCVECGHVCSVPKRWFQYHGNMLLPPEVVDTCPVCGGGLVQTRICDSCKEPITSTYYTVKGFGEFCDACVTERDITENI